MPCSPPWLVCGVDCEPPRPSAFVVLVMGRVVLDHVCVSIIIIIIIIIITSKVRQSRGAEVSKQ